MNSNQKLKKILGTLLILAIIAVAVFIAFIAWNHYEDDTWTRDGRVRANIVMVAPDVDGLVSDVYIHDNEFVKKGEILFEINKLRFIKKLQKLQDDAQTKKILYEMKKQEYARRAVLSSAALSKENRINAKLEVALAKKAYEAAQMQVQSAAIDLRRASVRAPVSGWITNLQLRKGEYLARGESHLSIIQKGTFWVYGYFKEYNIALLHVRQRVIIEMFGSDHMFHGNYQLKGHIQSIAKGITDRDNAFGEKNLANVKPIVQWMRLTQRVPVRIHIDTIPKGFPLVAGMSCTIRVVPENKR